MRNNQKAFTIIELLVVVSIIALLIGILLPAIGKARDRAHQTRSMANLRTLGQAHATYAAEWNDNQWTTGPHNLAEYGTDLDSAVNGFKQAFNGNPRSVSFCDNGLACVRLGFANTVNQGQDEYFWSDEANSTHSAIVPMDFDGGTSVNYRIFGYFRMINAKPFNQYVGGRVYDMTFFAPKDRAVLSAIGECVDAPGEFCGLTGSSEGGAFSSSYILSPAALLSPDLMAAGFSANTMFTMPATFRTPTFGQVRHPDLKTHMLEHHWLQKAKRECMPGVGPPLAEYDACAPYFFNASRDSVPATLFYDGHVEMLGVQEAIQANAQACAAGGGHLFNPNTPLGGGNDNNCTVSTGGGYFHGRAYAPAGAGVNPSSYHILTRGGVLGRDTLSR